MKKLSNPFLVYGYESPEYFCDREAETTQLISDLRNGWNITLFSPRRMGKTGLIKNAFYRLQYEAKDTVCVYVDIFGTNDLSDFVQAFGTALSKPCSPKARRLCAVPCSSSLHGGLW